MSDRLRRSPLVPSRLHLLSLVCGLLAGCRGGSTSAPADEGAVGMLDKEDIRAVVRAHLGEVRTCYERLALARDPDARGRVTVNFTIGRDGSVTHATADRSRTADSLVRVGGCIVAATKAWKFPEPEGGGSVEVTYPFVLEPSESVRSPSGLVEGEQTSGQWFALADRPPGTLVVEVVEPEGAAAAGVEVTLRVYTRGPDATRVATTDASGRVEFADLPADGTATVVLAADAKRPETRSTSVSLSAGAMGTILLRKRGE